MRPVTSLARREEAESPRQLLECPQAGQDATPGVVPPMFLIEIYLPTRDNYGNRFPQSAFEQVRNELTERFGGVTAFMRSPAMGLWADRSGEVRRDDIAIFEVMTDAVDRDWWQEYRTTLESRFRQDEVVVRAIQIERL